MTSIAASEPREMYPGSTHVTLSVFAGPDPGHRALVGTLTGYPAEIAEIRGRLQRTERDPREAIATVGPFSRARTAMLADLREGKVEIAYGTGGAAVVFDAGVSTIATSGNATDEEMQRDIDKLLRTAALLMVIKAERSSADRKP